MAKKTRRQRKSYRQSSLDMKFKIMYRSIDEIKAKYPQTASAQVLLQTYLEKERASVNFQLKKFTKQ